MHVPERFHARYQAGWHAGYAAAAAYANDGGNIETAEAAFDAGAESAPSPDGFNGWFEAGWDAGWDAQTLKGEA